MEYFLLILLWNEFLHDILTFAISEVQWQESLLKNIAFEVFTGLSKLCFLSSNWLINILIYFFKAEQKAKVWAFLLWKDTQIQQETEKDGSPNSWKLYQQWCNMDNHVRDCWITAGKTIQTFTKISNTQMHDGSVDCKYNFFLHWFIWYLYWLFFFTSVHKVIRNGDENTTPHKVQNEVGNMQKMKPAVKANVRFLVLIILTKIIN